MKKALLISAVALWAAAATAEIPAGYYYKADGLIGKELKSALNDICSQGKFLSYGGEGAGFTWEGFFYTDRNADSTVVDMYSNEKFRFSFDADGNPDFKAVAGMHIEHALPKSWWGSIEYNAYKDLNHLFPAEGKINSAKNDLPLGQVDPAKTTSDNGVSKVGKNTFRALDYDGNCFEPANEFKGDFARAYFYVATVYEEFAPLWQSPMMDNNTYPVWKEWALDLLLKWHRGDPVSQKERDRQEQVYAVQGNRNPFIDFPNLAEMIWGDLTDKPFEAPTNFDPFLITPTRWDSHNFGIVMEGNNQTQKFTVEGLNLTSEITLSLIGENDRGDNGQLIGTPFSLSKRKISANDALNATEITLTFNASQLGDFADTILITSLGLTDIKIPVHATVTDQFMALPPTEIGATETKLEWMNVAGAESYEIDVFCGNNVASDLFFSYYIDGTSNNKAVAIYNGTGRTVDLSKYAIKKQTNGIGNFRGDDNLSGTLENGKTFVVAYIGANSEIRAKADLVLGEYDGSKYSQTVISFNGNDAVALYHSGIQIDVIGEIGNTQYWENKETLVRRSSVNGPTTQFDWNEWIRQPKDYIDGIDAHKATFGTREFVLKSKNVGNQSQFVVKNLVPETDYYFSVKTKSGKQTDNTIRWRTNGLAAPLALEAEAVYCNEFVPSWETVNGASQRYLIDILKLEGVGLTHETEGFDDIETAKTAGWNFGTTETSTGAAYVGVAAPAIAFKNVGDQLVSKIYADTVSELSFMHRYGAKKAKGEGDNTSKLLFEASNGAQWTAIDTLCADSTTTKYTRKYTFDRTLGYTQFRWTYINKVYGSVTFDDVAATLGYVDTVMLAENVDWYAGWAVRNSILENDTIEPEQNYCYRLRATVGDYSSGYSNLICVTTLAAGNENPDPKPNIVPEEPETPIQIVSADSNVLIWSDAAGIGLQCLPEQSRIRIFDIAGRLVFDRQNATETLFVPIAQHGIFVVQVNETAIKVAK